MKKLYILTVVLLTGLMLQPAALMRHAHAVEIADQPCDANYWRQMKSRAWMEAEREIMQNQNLIFKADSVLEYTCFDQFVSVNAWQAGNLFVHTDYFGEKIIKRATPPEAMENALTAVVSNALAAYKGTSPADNFVHSFLGGRANFMGAEMSNSAFRDAKTNVAYTCQTMSKVWKAAKCANFIDNSSFESTDGFYPFDAIKGYKGAKDVAGYNDTIQETRSYPSAMDCRGSGPSANLGAMGSWLDQLKIAENRDEAYKFQTPLKTIFEDVGLKLKPGTCGAAIKTGVEVIIDGEKSHDDGVCTNPGCSYTSAGTCTNG